MEVHIMKNGSRWGTWESPVKWIFEELEYTFEQFDWAVHNFVYKLTHEFRYLLLPKDHVCTEILDELWACNWENQWLLENDADWTDHLAQIQQEKISAAIEWFNFEKPWWVPAKKHVEV